jgi:cystathionine beta-lyase
MKQTTECVHAGHNDDPQRNGLNTPVYTSSAFGYIEGDHQPYPRYFNTPNQEALAAKLCALEGAEAAVVFSSGMAAISTTLFAMMQVGDHAVFQDEIYGGTLNLLSRRFSTQGLKFSLASTDADAIIAAIVPDTRLVYLESPTNPLLTVVDICKVTEAARERGVLTLIDSTFASPINQNPLALGVDLVLHSGTKYLGGHSDLCSGVVLGSREPIARVREVALCFGGSLNAEECYLLERSLKTLSLRVERQSANALRLARSLESLPGVTRVYYPGLESHPGHAIARSQMRGFGGVLTFAIKGDAQDFMRSLRLITPALSLGGVESTVCTPATTSHRHLTAEQRHTTGIHAGLLRLSVGIEDADDLLDDLRQALSRVAR